ncbi:MAG: hypothetical protein AAAFM81_10455 [Pseudomonadota bacterium]
MNETEIVLKLAQQAVEAKEPDYIGDLIKIGLPIIGTLIGGVIGYLATRKAAELNHDTQIQIAAISHNAELEKAFYEKRLVRLERLVTHLDSFNQRTIAYCTDVKNWLVHKSEGNEDKLYDLSRKIQSSQAAFYDSFLPLLNAEAKLLILGHTGLQEQLRSFGEYAQEVYKHVHIENAEITTKAIDARIESLKEKRKDLYVLIGQHEAAEYQRATQPIVRPADPSIP